MPVPLAHRAADVIGRIHRLFHYLGQKLQITACGRGRELGVDGRIVSRTAHGQFIKADCDRLAEVHGGLLGIGGDLKEQMAEGEVVAREAVFFRAKDKRYATASFKLIPDKRGEIGKRDHALFRLAIGQSPRAEDEGGGGDGVRAGRMLVSVFEEFRRADGGVGFAPVSLERSDDGEVRKAEVGHGPGHRADIERVAWGDEHDVDAVALFELGTLRRQEMIVLREVIRCFLEASFEGPE